MCCFAGSSVRLFVCSSVRLFVCSSVCRSVGLSVGQSVGRPFYDYHTQDRRGDDTTDPPSASTNELPIPAPITQLAWLLHSLLSQDQEGNEEILNILVGSTSSSRSSLSADSMNPDALARLGAHLAILSNMLAQKSSAQRKILDDSS